MRRAYILLGALAFLLGALAPLTVSAEEYDDLGTLAEGVHMVESDGDRLRLTADDDAGVVVYDPSGELVLARQLDGGDEHDLVLQSARHIVAVFGGPASLEATGEGEIHQLDVERERVELASADGEAVDASLTVELPRALVGITGTIEGQAEDLVTEARAGDRTVFRAHGDELSEVDKQIAPRVLDAGAFDLTVDASRLNGTVWLELITPVLDRPTATASNADDADEGLPEAPAIHDVAHTPMQVTLETPATLTFDMGTGYLLDASVFDDAGKQVLHVHRGPDLAKARNHCQDVMDCPPTQHPRYSQFPPETVERTLEPGTYIVYVREGAVEGNLTLTDDDGVSLLDEVERLEMTGTSVHEASTLSFERPVLDVYAETWSTGVQQSLTVDVDGETVYSYDATVAGPGAEVDSDRSMAPEKLGAGNVTVSIGGLSDPQGSLAVQLYTVTG